MTTSFDELFDQMQNKSKGENSSSFDQLFEQVQSKQPSRARSLINAPLKGAIKGAAKFSPIPSFGPVPFELGEKVTEQVLPTQNKDLEDILEFSGENIPAVALGEGGLAKKGLQAISGAIGKKGAKELELPEWAQEISGTAGMIGPSLGKSLANKKITPSSKQQSVVDFLRAKGFGEDEITPLIQSKKKLALLSKAALKYEERSPFLRGIQDKLGDIYTDVRERGTDKYLRGEDFNKFNDKFTKILDKLNPEHRRIIEKNIEDLQNKPLDFKSLHDFNVTINDKIKAATGGKASIGALKEATHEAQKAIDPSLFKELRQTDEAYSRLKNFTKKMTNTQLSNLINLGEAGHAIYGLLTLNPGAMKVALGTAAVRGAARQVLTNPRLQNIHTKMWEALLDNKIPQLIKLSKLLEKELTKSSWKDDKNTDYNNNS
jgi:hypothetical protein